jgi:uncharacterized circularly permuted ATP-grasp superfamily protein
MTIAADLTASLIALDRLHQTLLEDGLHHRATLLARSLDNIRDCADRARLIEEGIVPRHFLPQPGEAAVAIAPGQVVSLAAAKARRDMGAWR